MGCIALITDFGAGSSYAGSLKGAVLRFHPEVRLVDVSHTVPPHSIAEGAFLLDCVWDDFPEETVFLVVVDPGVGTKRAPIAARFARRWFVGPDNGLVSLVQARHPFEQAVQLTRRFVEEPSATFEGRDVFAPAAAWLAAGKPAEALGPRLEKLSASFEYQAHFASENSLVVRVLHVDTFGNVLLSARSELVPVEKSPKAVYAPAGRLELAGRVRTYGEIPRGRIALLKSSSGWLEIAAREASAAEKLKMSAGDSLEIVFD